MSPWRSSPRLATMLAGGVLAAACSTSPPPPSRPAPPVIATPIPPSAPGGMRELPPAPLAATPPAPAAPRVGRPQRVMRAQPISLTMRCAARDQRRHTVQADLDVAHGEVRYLRARVADPLGACEFALPDFRQTRMLPSIELRATASECVLHIWEQGPQVVLAYSRCAQHCEPQQAFSDMLPILFDRRVGRCD